jgi:creatinine amidohydrolase
VNASLRTGVFSRFWSDWSARDFVHLREHGGINEAVAVLPVAAIEQHGPHLPVSVDTTLTEGVIRASLAHLPDSACVLFLPTQSVGKSNEHLRFPGTLTLGADLLARLWFELGACVARAGFRRLLLLNGHGGQVALMETVARDLRVELGLLTLSSSWFALPMAEEVRALFTAQEHRFGIHAGDIETSMMLALAPHTVRMEYADHFESSSIQRARDYPLLGQGAARLAWQMQDLHPMGAAGDASIATAAKGEAVIEDAGRKLAALLLEVARLPLETLRDTTGWPGAQRRPAGWITEAPDTAGAVAVARHTRPDTSP